MATCYKCFSEYEGSGSCPECGFDITGQEERYPHALRPGTIVGGRYIVGRVLGQGGFGITYAAQDYDTKGLVAIKEFMPETLATRINHTTVKVYSAQYETDFNYGKENFLNEAKTLSQFNGQSNICDIYTYFEENGTAYFAMEYVNGIGLDDYLKQHGGPLSFEEARKLLMPLMRALSNVHAKGIIHRDISPDNIMVQPDGNVMLIDFGAARYSMGEKSQSLDVILKHGFAPKEQYARHGRQGPYTDVYAMASTFYYAVTGKVLMDAVERKESDIIPMPGLSKSQYKALEKALAIEPAKRWQSMKDFISAVEKAKAEPVKKPKTEEPKITKTTGTKLRQEPKGTEAPAKPAFKLEKKHITAISAAALLLLPIIIFSVSGGKKEPEPTPTPTPEITPEPVTAVESGTLAIEGNANITWEFFDDGTLRLSGEGPIPNRGSAYMPWHDMNLDKKITVIEIGPGITEIGRATFSGMDILERIDIAEGVTKIDEDAFAYAHHLSSVNLPSSLEEIGDEVFYGCSALGSIELPEALTSIGSAAFSDCESLESIALPSGLEVISDNLFRGCTALKNVELGGNIKEIAYGAFDGCTALNTIGIPASVESIDNTAFDDSGLDLVIYIGGDEAMWNKVCPKYSKLISTKVSYQSLVDWAYDKASKTLTLSGSGKMENYSFDAAAPWAEYAGEMEKLVISEGVKSIGSCAFADCVELKEVSLPYGIATIEEYAFYGCTGLEKLELPKRLSYIEEFAFAYCENLGSVRLPEGLGGLAASVFKLCTKLESVYFPSTISGIFENAFEGCPIKTAYYAEKKFEKIRDLTLNCPEIEAAKRFAYGEWKDSMKWTLDEGGTLTFSGTDVGGLAELDHALVKKIIVEPGVKRIDSCDEMPNLREVILPEGLEEIGEEAFANCPNLRSINIPESVKVIGEKAFYDCTALSLSIEFSDSLEEIGESAFSGSAVRAVSLPAGVHLGTDCFNSCSALSSVEIRGAIESIPARAFRTCSSLREIVIPDGIQSMGEEAFRGCSSLTKVVIGKGLKTIPDKAFIYCEYLSSLTLSEGLVSIGEHAFENCFRLQSVELPEGFRRLELSAFNSCKALRSVSIPVSIETVEMAAFMNCEALDTVYFGGSMKQWDRLSFGDKNEPLHNAQIISTEESAENTEENK